MRVADAIVRLALRLSAAGVLAPIGRMVATGEASIFLIAVAGASGIAVAALLFLAYRLNKRDKR